MATNKFAKFATLASLTARDVGKTRRPLQRRYGVEIRKWEHSEALSEEFLKDKFEHPKYRVSAHEYESGTKFSGASEKGFVFVIEGACKIKTVEGSVLLNKDHYIEQPKGTYNLSVISSTTLKIVSVWNVEELIEQNT